MKEDDRADPRELDDYVQDVFELLEQFAAASRARRERRLGIAVQPGHPLWDEGIADRRRRQLVGFAHELVLASVLS